MADNGKTIDIAYRFISVCLFILSPFVLNKIHIIVSPMWS